MSQLLGAPVRRIGYRPITKLLRHVEDIGGLVYGGYARYLVTINPRQIKPFADIDIYPKSKQYTNNILDYLQRHLTFIGGSNYNGVKAHSFEYGRVYYGPLKIQIIEKYGTPESIINDFDITLCQVMVSMKHRTCFFTRDFWNDLVDNRFRYRYPIGTKDTEHAFYRITKYLNKGFALDMRDFVEIYRNLTDDHDKDFFISYLKQSVDSDLQDKVLDWPKIKVIDTFAMS